MGATGPDSHLTPVQILLQTLETTTTSFCPSYFGSLRSVDKYLAIIPHICTNSFRALIAAWLKTSHRSWIVAAMNRRVHQPLNRIALLWFDVILLSGVVRHAEDWCVVARGRDFVIGTGHLLVEEICPKPLRRKSTVSVTTAYPTCVSRSAW